MSFDKSRVQALCFDVDGTLSDTDDQFVEQLARWLRPLRAFYPGHDPQAFARKLVMVTESPGNYLFGIPDRLGIDDKLVALTDWIYRLGLRNIPQPFLLVPGVFDMLETFKGRYPMAIVSVRGARSTGLFLKQFSLAHFFEVIVTSQSCKHTKPYPDPVIFAAEKMGVDPQSCLMIGDTTIDIRAGKAAGAQTAGVLCGFGEERELRRVGADIILSNTAQLTTILN